MSFSAETKNELARVISNDDYCNKTELAAIVRLAGSIQIAGYRKLNLKITTELNSVARKVFKLLKQNFGINTTISVNKNQMLKHNENSHKIALLINKDSSQVCRKLAGEINWQYDEIRILCKHYNMKFEKLFREKIREALASLLFFIILEYSYNISLFINFISI